MDVRVGHKESWGPKNWCFWNCGVEEDSQRVPWTARRSNHSILKNSVLNIHWKRPWYWERLKAEGEGDDRGWDGWMASLTQWTWVWVSSGSWWWTGKPGVLQSMGSQRVRHDWATELNRFRLCLFLKTLALLNYTIQSSDQSSWSINLPMLPNFALIPVWPWCCPKDSQQVTSYRTVTFSVFVVSGHFATVSIEHSYIFLDDGSLLGSVYISGIPTMPICGVYSSYLFFHLFLLVGGWKLYNIVVVFAIHWHESAVDLHVFPILIPSPTSLPILEIELPYDPAVPLLGIHTEETRSERDTCTPMFIAAVFIIARIWKQPRCPSAEKWIRKLWYIYTMEYYSAIKKNSFESVLMRWMKLEPIIQSEVSQNDKHQYRILTHIVHIYSNSTL